MSTFLKKEFEDNGFSTIEPVTGLLVVETFISQDEISSFLNLIESTKEKDWSILYLEGLKPFCLQKFGRDDVENLVAEGKFEITQGWEDKNLAMSDNIIAKEVHQRLNSLIETADSSLELNTLSLQRMQSGVSLKSHTDEHTDPSIKYAAIIYLNDNYIDGEVFFMNKGVSLRPKPGSLLVFPGTEDFEHGVNKVGDGPIRYVIPSFIKMKNFYKENRY